MLSSWGWEQRGKVGRVPVEAWPETRACGPSNGSAAWRAGQGGTSWHFVGLEDCGTGASRVVNYFRF